MSIDKPRSQKDITSEISKREQDKARRLKDTQKVVRDKKIEANVSRSLRLSGSSEGVSEVKKSLEKAAEATNKEFDRQEKDLQRKNFDPAKKLEKNLMSRSEATKADIHNLRKAVSQIDTKSAQAMVNTAEKSATRDRERIDRSKKKQETVRIKGEKELDRQIKETKGTRVSFRK